jgi:GntR family transcriptional regulator, rspAB operon transcriptional repressor
VLEERSSGGVSTSLADQVYGRLLDEISDGRWDVGETVSAYALARTVGVSRTPVVEALKRLESEGLIEIVPRVGARLVRSTPDAIDELVSIVSLFLGLAAERAATRVDDEWLKTMEAMVEALSAAARHDDRAEFMRLSRAVHASLFRAGLPRYAQAAEQLWRLMRAQARRHHRRIIDAGVLFALEPVVEALRAGSPQRARAAAERYVAALGAELRRSAEIGPPGRPDSSNGLEHAALLYSSKSDFLGSTLPFVLGGLERGESVLVVSRPDNLEAVASSLGAERSKLELRDSAQWYDGPASALRRYRDYIDASANGSRVRVIGEPPWSRLDDQTVEDWIRYESVINVALETSPASILCPYDAGNLPPQILGGARAAHPHLYEAGRPTESPEYTDFFTTSS